jgi:hypothetical protein
MLPLLFGPVAIDRLSDRLPFLMAQLQADRARSPSGSAFRRIQCESE